EMFEVNQTTVTEFEFLGFQNIKTINTVLFLLFLVIYMSTLTGNLLIILLVAHVPSLKSPMYFFLTQLSLSDILLTTNIVPNLLHIIINERNKISFASCITQFYFYGVSAAAESLLLATMSYDRYLAICDPLHYISIMDLKLRLKLVLLSWTLACLVMLFTVCLICNVTFCGPHIIDHYFCDIAPILELSCSDHSIIDLSYFTLAILFALIPFFLILFTYISIFITISQISSSNGKQKSFSTCSSHLMVVSTYYGTLITIYMVPSKGQSYNVNKVISLLYTVGTPFCNPIIYSLRNQEIKNEWAKIQVNVLENIEAVSFRYSFMNLQTVNIGLFVLFLTIYILTLAGNLLIVLLVAKVPCLQYPMYFFLSNLSLSDILLTTNVVPNLLHCIINGGSSISITGCLTQLYFYGVSAAGECLLLTVMSYDRYLAICDPLHYIIIMDPRLRVQLALWSWLLACMVMVFIAFLICNLQFCGPHLIDHYFCDIAPVLDLTCSDHTIVDFSYFILAILFALIPFSFILFTYISIFITVSQISSSSGKQKAFSTCSSHLMVVSTYYGTLITIYLVPSKGRSYNVNKIISLLYTMGTPFCNPIIYSLRNQEIKTAVMRGMHLNRSGLLPSGWVEDVL
ncbi:olfactory receptor 9K2-like, partial [Pelobates cultripes]